MRVAVVGTGYVGLVAGACFSDTGNHVTCVDLDPAKIESLNRGIVPIYEPGLDDVVARNVEVGRLKFTTQLRDAVASADVVIVAVGTPSGEDGSADVQYVMEALDAISSSLVSEAVIVLKSTVPVGTADRAREVLSRAKFPTHVVSNPEFLREGTAITDFMHPERVIVGCDSAYARRVMGELYAPCLQEGSPILFMDNRSAELAKYAANTFLAMKISFINEMANLCERVGADIHEIWRGLVSDSRVGKSFLHAGCGYGGSCFPKDVRAVIDLGRKNGMDVSLYSATNAINERQKKIIFQKMAAYFREGLRGVRVAVWGLAFKPGTDDMREAPALELIRDLVKAGAQVVAYDPVAVGSAARILGDAVSFSTTAMDAVAGADALAVMTEWGEFLSPDLAKLKSLMKRPVIFDGRNIFRLETLREHGFVYHGIGRPSLSRAGDPASATGSGLRHGDGPKSVVPS